MAFEILTGYAAGVGGSILILSVVGAIYLIFKKMKAKLLPQSQEEEICKSDLKTTNEFPRNSQKKRKEKTVEDDSSKSQIKPYGDRQEKYETFEKFNSITKEIKCQSLPMMNYAVMPEGCTEVLLSDCHKEIPNQGDLQSLDQEDRASQDTFLSTSTRTDTTSTSNKGRRRPQYMLHSSEPEKLNDSIGSSVNIQIDVTSDY